MGRVGGQSQPFMSIGLVIGEIAVIEHYLTVVLKGQDMGGNPVEKPAIMADDDGAPGK